MTNSAVAFSFDSSLRLADESSSEKVSAVESDMLVPELSVYTSGEECRSQLKSSTPAVSVIVNNSAGETSVGNGASNVTPINLAAALCVDCPERDVYLMEDHPTATLAFNVRAAGIRGIIDHRQSERLSRSKQFIETKRSIEPCGEGLTVLERPKLSPSFEPPYSLPNIPTLPQIQVIGSNNTEDKGRVLGVFSGRGGVGKSTVALMCALKAQQRGLRVALVDLDLQFGDLGFLAGREPSSRIQRMPLSQVCDMPSLPELAEDALTLITAPESPEQGEEFTLFISGLLNELATSRDLVVVNTGSFWTGIHAKIIQSCTHIALLMDQRATSIEACKQVVDLCLKLQAPQASFMYLLNGCGRHATFTAQDVSLALGCVEVFGLADGGLLVDELLSLGCPMELLNSGNAFVSSLESVLNSLLGDSGAQAAQSEFDGNERSSTKTFDFGSLRRFFGGARRVAT